MRGQVLTLHRCIYFSAWSQKGYAIFAGFGKEVRISPLSLYMFGMVLLKSALKGIIVNTDKVAEMVGLSLLKEEMEACMWRSKGEVCPLLNMRFNL